MQNDFKNMLQEGLQTFGVTLNEKQVQDFSIYHNILKEWNEKMNLTAITDDKDAVIKHYIDSLSILSFIKNDKTKLIDIGTGAGFPGIPIKIVYNSIDVTLFDSLEKRTKFLNHVIETLNLKDIRTVHGRAEDFGNNKSYREKFDIAVARAVANLPVLLEYCLPFIKPGGVFIAMKGSNIDELKDADNALNILGGKVLEIKELVLPFSDIRRNIVVISKTNITPAKFPRKAGTPIKSPL